MTAVTKAQDVTERHLRHAAEIEAGFYPPGQPIAWDEFMRRLEEWAEIDLGDEMDSPAIRKIQRYVRELRSADS